MARYDLNKIREEIRLYNTIQLLETHFTNMIGEPLDPTGEILAKLKKEYEELKKEN